MRSVYAKVKNRLTKYHAEHVCRLQGNPLEGFGKTVVTIFHDFEGDYSSPGRTKPCLWAVEKILDIESKYDIRGTYNTVAKFAQDIPDFLKEIEGRGHEIASHSYEHQVLSSMPRAQQLKDIKLAKQVMSDLGITIAGHRSPQSATPGKLYRSLLKEGYSWVAQDGREPYPYIYKRADGDVLWRFPVRGDDWAYEGQGFSPSEMLAYWRAMVNEAREKKLYVAIGLHPWVQSSPDRLQVLDDFLGWVSTLDDVVLESFGGTLDMMKNVNVSLNRRELR